MIDLMENKVFGPRIRQGIEQGLEQGRQEGRQEGMREVLRVLMAERFGPLPAWALRAIDQAGPSKLAAWSIGLLKADTIDGLLG